MPRRRRSDYPGAWHHVMNRTIEGVALFDDDTDRQIFLVELRDALQATRTELHGYCLMSNHYHLLLHTPVGGLSELMQKTISKFTQKMNIRRHRDGPLFRGRFNSISPDNDGHLLNISAYIHLNPVKAGLTRSPEDWTWSSAAAYIGATSAPSWLCTASVLEMFGTVSPQTAYQQFLVEKLMQTGSDPSHD